MDILKIANVLKENDNIAIVIHINPDSDCLGSGAALLLALKSMGKNAKILVDSPVPNRLSFYVDSNDFGSADDEYDVCVAVDVAAPYMMGQIKEKVFDKAKITCCLDHHKTNCGYADYNYVDGSAAAAGEIMYSFIKDCLGVEIDKEIAYRLYGAIAADTGSFQYSNTTPVTHSIASSLMAMGIDTASLMRTLFERKTKEQLMLKAEVTQNLRFYADGKICVAVVDNELLDKYNTAFEEADDLASLPRSIVGVEVGVYLKVKGENEVKASLRSNEYVNVSDVAVSLGGGGHMRAAGITINESREKAEKIIVEALEKIL